MITLIPYAMLKHKTVPFADFITNPIIFFLNMIFGGQTWTFSERSFFIKMLLFLKNVIILTALSSLKVLKAIILRVITTITDDMSVNSLFVSLSIPMLCDILICYTLHCMTITHHPVINCGCSYIFFRGIINSIPVNKHNYENKSLLW